MNGDWQPIETAPRDWSDVYIYNDEYGVVTAYYSCEDGGGDCWVLTNKAYDDESAVVEHPTHWQPLPPLPEPPK